MIGMLGSLFPSLSCSYLYLKLTMKKSTAERGEDGGGLYNPKLVEMLAATKKS